MNEKENLKAPHTIDNIRNLQKEARSKAEVIFIELDEENKDKLHLEIISFVKQLLNLKREFFLEEYRPSVKEIRKALDPTKNNKRKEKVKKIGLYTGKFKNYILELQNNDSILKKCIPRKKAINSFLYDENFVTEKNLDQKQYVLSEFMTILTGYQGWNDYVDIYEEKKYTRLVGVSQTSKILKSDIDLVLNDEIKNAFKKYRITIIDSKFIEQQKERISNPKSFYEFRIPEWTDVIFNHDVKRDQQDKFIKLINENSEYQFFTILAPSGEGKSTFLKRIAIEQLHQNSLILFWEMNLSTFNNIDVFIEDLSELYESLQEQPIFLFIDNCFEVNIEKLVHVLIDFPNLKIIGSSQTAKYKKPIEKYRKVRLPFFLNKLSIKEVDDFQNKLVQLNLIQEITKEQLKKKNYIFEDLIAELIPENKINVRVADFISRIKNVHLIKEIFTLVCLSYRYEINLPFETLLSYLEKKEKKEFFKGDINLIIQEFAKGEIIFNSHFLRLRHEIWAVEGLRNLGINKASIHENYLKLFYYLDYSIEENRKFLFHLFDKFEGQLAKKTYNLEKFHFVVLDVRNHLSMSEFRKYLTLEKRFNIANNNYQFIKKFIKEKKKVHSNDSFLLLINDYFSFLEKKHFNNKKIVAEKFLNLTEPITEQSGKELWSIAIEEKNYELLYETYLSKLYEAPNHTGLIGSYIYILHLLKEEDKLIKMMTLDYNGETLNFKLIKLKYFLAKKEYHKAYNYSKKFSDQDLESKSLMASYQESVFHYDYKEGLEIVKKYKKEENNKWSFMEIELFLIQNKKSKIKEFLKSTKFGREVGFAKDIWFIIALAANGNFNKSSYLFKKYINYYDIERVIGKNSVLQKLYYYLGKYWIQKIGLVDKALILLKKSKDYGYLNRDFDYKIEDVFVDFSDTIKDQFLKYNNKSKIIIKLVNSIIKHKELIGDKNFESLFNFFEDYLQTNINTNNKSLILNEAYIKMLLYLKKYNEIEEHYLMRFEEFSDNPAFLNSYGNFQKEIKQNFILSEKYYQQSIKLSEHKNAYYLNNLAILYIEFEMCEKYDLTETLLNEAIEINPNFGYAKENLKIIEKFKNIDVEEKK